MAQSRSQRKQAPPPPVWLKGKKCPNKAQYLSGRRILEAMRRMHLTWLWYPGKKIPERVLETPTKTQAEVLKAFGWVVDSSGVLQRVSA